MVLLAAPLVARGDDLTSADTLSAAEDRGSSAGWENDLPADLLKMEKKEAGSADNSKRAFTDSCSFAGRVKHESAIRVRDSHQLTKIRTTVAPRESCILGPDLSVHSSQRFWYDGVFDLSDNYPETVAGDLETEHKLRDLYVDYSFGDFDVRLGQQQIVWGETIGIFVADVVNAKDYREFLLPEFSEINIPEPAVDLEYSKDSWHAQIIWLPRPRFNRLPPSGSEFEFNRPPVPPDATIASVQEPSDSLGNSEIGGRLGYLWDGWDLGGFYLHTWDKSPAYARFVRNGEISIEPSHERLDIAGLTFSKELDDIVWRGELAFNRGAFFSVDDLSDEDGLQESDFLDYALAADFRISNRTRANVQLLQHVLTDYQDNFSDNTDHLSTYLSFWMKSEYVDATVMPELFVISSIDTRDAMIRPKIANKIADDLLLSTGLDWFIGGNQKLFGQFERKSRAYIELVYDF